MGTKISDPQTNVARVGRLRAIYFAPTKHPEKGYDDQIKVDGIWEQEGPGFWYTSVKDLLPLSKAGLVFQVQGETDSDGRPRFAVAHPDQRMAWLRAEEKPEGGGKKRIVTKIYAVDLQGQAVTLPAQAVPSVLNRPTPAAAAAAPTAAAPVVPPAPGAIAPPAPAPATPAASAPVAPAAPPAPAGPTPEQLREQMRQRWAELDERYAAALAIASYRLREALNGAGSPEVIQAGAATVLIESNKLNLSALPGLAKALRDRANGKQAADQSQAPPKVPAPAGPGGYEDRPEALDDLSF